MQIENVMTTPTNSNFAVPVISAKKERKHLENIN